MRDRCGREETVAGLGLAYRFTGGDAMIAPGIEVGSTLPDATLRDLDGNAFQLGALRGRRLMLFMWASW